MEELEVIKASFNKYSINSKINFDYKINGNRLEFSGHTFEFIKTYNSIEARCLSMSYVVAIFDDYYNNNNNNFDNRLLASIRFNPCFDDSCNDIKCNSIVLYSCRSAIYFCKSNNYNPENLICLTRDKELAKKKIRIKYFSIRKSMMIYLVSENEYFYSPAIDRKIKGTATIPLEAFDNKQDAILFCGTSSIKKINNLISSGKIKQFIPSYLTEEKENFIKKHNIKDFKVKPELLEEFMKVFDFNFYVVNEVKLHSICG